MDRGTLLRQLDELFELDTGTLKGGELLDEIGWDSVRVIEFIVLAEEQASVEVSPDILRECSTVDDLIALLKGLPS